MNNREINLENISLKNRGVYIILGLLFGLIGIHNFYIGNYTRAIIQLLLFTFGGAISVIIGFIIWLLPIAFYLVYGIWVLIEIITTTRDSYGRLLT